MRWLRGNWVRLTVHLSGVISLCVVFVTYFANIPVQPVRYLILRTGTFGLIFLIASLACTPLRQWFGWPKLMRVRRALGLYGFLYITIHFLAYAIIENQLYFDLIWRDLAERRAMPIGILAFLLLVPLAVTSTRGWQRRLGKGWRKLHRLVYFALPLSIWHYLWLDRDFMTWPIIYGIGVTILLLMRLPRLHFITHKGE